MVFLWIEIGYLGSHRSEEQRYILWILMAHTFDLFIGGKDKGLKHIEYTRIFAFARSFFYLFLYSTN